MPSILPLDGRGKDSLFSAEPFATSIRLEMEGREILAFFSSSIAVGGKKERGG